MLPKMCREIIGGQTLCLLNMSHKMKYRNFRQRNTIVGRKQHSNGGICSDLKNTRTYTVQR